MKFHVSGSHRDTGARMSLEFEADSKGAAERKASQSGMNVHRIVNLDDPEPDVGTGGERSGIHPLIKLIILLAILAGLWLFVWPMVRTRM